MKRKLCQLLSCLAANPFWGNFLTGQLYKGEAKAICAPGLNCWSCPTAALSCPLGALQTLGAKADLSLYVSGYLLGLGILLGRSVCGYLCPFGLVQELLYKIPAKKRRLWPQLSYLKYLMLGIFVLLMPLASGSPTFCRYICPAGTIEAGWPLVAAHEDYRGALGYLFLWKSALAVGIILGCIAVSRFFCRTLCPLGAVYGLFNRLSLYRLDFDPARCVSCQKCQRACPMAIDPRRDLDSVECIRCGECKRICPQKAIKNSLK